MAFIIIHLETTPFFIVVIMPFRHFYSCRHCPHHKYHPYLTTRETPYVMQQFTPIFWGRSSLIYTVQRQCISKRALNQHLSLRSHTNPFSAPDRVSVKRETDTYQQLQPPPSLVSLNPQTTETYAPPRVHFFNITSSTVRGPFR